MAPTNSQAAPPIRIQGSKELRLAELSDDAPLRRLETFEVWLAGVEICKPCGVVIVV